MNAVLKLTGLTADRLRAWEKRYGAVQPARSANGRRSYQESEVKRLKLLAALVDAGHAIGSIARLPDETLIHMAAEAHREPHPHRGDELLKLVEFLERFDLARIRAELGKMRFAISPRDFSFQIVPHLLMLVGKRIDAGTLSIAQEHALSEILQGHLREVYESLAAVEGLREPEGAFIFCTREGDPHDFGLLMAAIACRSAGLRTNYVGRGLPLEALREIAWQTRPRAVVIGLAELPPTEEKVSAASYVEGAHAALPPETEFWLGGPAASRVRRPAARTCFGFATIEELEEKLRLMLPG